MGDMGFANTLIWYHTHIDRQSQDTRDSWTNKYQIYKYIFTPPVTYTQQQPASPWMKKLGDTKIYFTEVHNAFANASADQIQKDYVLPVKHKEY